MSRKRMAGTDATAFALLNLPCMVASNIKCFESYIHKISMLLQRVSMLDKRRGVARDRPYGHLSPMLGFSTQGSPYNAHIINAKRNDGDGRRVDWDEAWQM